MPDMPPETPWLTAAHPPRYNPNMKPLTAKEEAFAVYLFQGYNQTEAFRLAYPNQKGAITTLTPNAARRAAKSNVKARLAELRGLAVQPAIADVVERKTHATGIMRDSDAKHRDQLAANKLVGEYEKDLGQPAPVVVNINTQLQQLVLFYDKLDLTPEQIAKLRAELEE